MEKHKSIIKHSVSVLLLIILFSLLQGCDKIPYLKIEFTKPLPYEFETVRNLGGPEYVVFDLNNDGLEEYITIFNNYENKPYNQTNVIIHTHQFKIKQQVGHT